MEHLTRSLKVLWRSERMLTKNEFRLMSQKLQLSALAGLVGLLGLVMVSLAVFFAILPHWGQSLAALAVGGIDLVLAFVLIAWAGSLKPAAEVEMVKEVRDMALADIEGELALAEKEMVTLKDEVHGFIKNPMDTLLPATVGPLLGAVGRSIITPKK